MSVANIQDVKLRPVMKQDAKTIFEWQIHPNTRKYARINRAPEWDEHCQWLDATLEDPRKSPYIIDYLGSAAGLLRLDQMDNENEFEISILISPEYYGRNIASTALALARKLKSEGVFKAEIHPDNLASRKLFLNQGYVAINDTWFVQNAE